MPTYGRTKPLTEDRRAKTRSAAKRSCQKAEGNEHETGNVVSLNSSGYEELDRQNEEGEQHTTMRTADDDLDEFQQKLM